jgi:hypothetical protein
MNHIFVAASAALILTLLAACGAFKPTPTLAPPTQEVIPVTGIQYHFVTNNLRLPTTKALTQEFSLNLDGNQQQHVQNLFGELLTLLTSAAPSLELQSNLDQAVNNGQLITLHDVKADDPLNDPSVSWSILQGQKNQSAPKFDGSDKFTIDPSATTNSSIVGSLTNGHFTGGPGTARVQMILLGQPVEVDLIGLRLEADLNTKGCTNGKLGGGVKVDDFRNKLLPAINDGLNQIIKVDKAGAAPLLQALDSDHNGTITIQELESNPILMLAISPDLDLLDSSGKFNPGQDGVKDSYSLGLGFTCVPATFTTPGN